MKTKKRIVHEQSGRTHYMGRDGRANLTICGEWIERVLEVHDTLQKLWDEDEDGGYHQMEEEKLLKRIQNSKEYKLCRICFKEFNKMKEDED